MPQGSKYAGQQAEATSRRSLRISEPDEKILEQVAELSEITVTQFYHAGQFWNARIPLDHVADVCGQAFNFSEAKTKVGPNGREVIFDKNGFPRRKIGCLYHVQSRFKFSAERPIQLFPIGGGFDGEPEHTLTDCVYSLEAVGPPGWDFNLSTGLKGDLIVAHRFMSMEDMVFERIVVENQYVSETPPLKLSDEEKRALLRESIMRSHESGEADRYFLFRFCGTNNCTSNPFQVLDRVVSYSWMERLGSLLYRLPISPRFYLRIRGVDSDPSIILKVRDEFEAFIGDKATQKRKREYVRRLIKQKRASDAASKNES